ncbi:MAG: hypothetical protein ACI93R_003211 [Flavobacteriales bacterium]|jgi:hypothetical protein
MSFKIVTLQSVFFTTVLFVSGLTKSAEISPSHVYKMVNNIANELTLIHEVNESEVTYSPFEINDRRPRHVIQKAREIYSKVQKLREINDLTVNSIPDFPTSEIKPAHVFEIISLILNDVKELSEPFGVEEDAAKASMPSNKTPNDVYLYLVKISDMIDSLDIPATVPNDVYQLAKTVINDIEIIREKLGVNGNVKLVTGSSGKTPADVYLESRDLLSSIKQLCNKNIRFCLPGGVVVPTSYAGAIKPTHVLDTLNNVLAELGAIKSILAISKPTVLSGAPSGKTPSDVFDVVLSAKRAVDNIK